MVQADARGGAPSGAPVFDGPNGGPPDEPEWLTAEEAADLLAELTGIRREPRTVYEWMKKGRLRSVRVGPSKRGVRTTRLWVVDCARRQVAARDPQAMLVVMGEAEGELDAIDARLAHLDRITALQRLPTPEQAARDLLPPGTPPETVAQLAPQIFSGWEAICRLPPPMGLQMLLACFAQAEKAGRLLERVAPGLLAASLVLLAFALELALETAT